MARRRLQTGSWSFVNIAVLLSISWAASITTVVAGPNPVGGFALCQTASSLHIQGGVAYGPSASFLVTTNQHFRLDLSQAFDSSSASSQPVWANLTSGYSPYQRFHAGACTPDSASFLTVGNADADGSSQGSFMMAYSVSDGTWNPVSHAVSAATGGSSSKNPAAGRTMTAFAIGGRNKGIVVGGGWLPSKTNTPSVLATELTNLATEADLIAFGNDGSLGSLLWAAGSDGSVNNNLGPVAGAKVVPLITASGKAAVLGGVTNGQRNVGLSFANIPIVDMSTGSVVLQKTQANSLFGTVPAPRYGHCVAQSADGSTIIMFGGSTVSNDKITNDLYLLDVKTWTWSQPSVKPTSLMPPPVRDHQCVVIGDQFLSLLGFNANQAPASNGAISGSSPPSPPPIYVLSLSQLSWSTQYKPLPGTPSPPPIPDIQSGKGKVNGAAIAFGTIFGLAFLGVIGYVIFSHKRKQRRKAETLVLLELQQKQKEESRLEKERQQRWNQQKDAPLPPTPPMAHMQPADRPSYYEYNPGYHNPPVYPPPPSSGSSMNPYQTQNPFHDPNYHQNQHLYSHGARHSNYPHQMPMHQNSTGYVPEEMGHIPSTMPGAHQGYEGPSEHSKVPLEYEGISHQAANLPSGSRNKESFIEPGPAYR
ncbi:hypothetical protein BGX31_000428 [Mortierella sp. GBA43]|nr:hypothetical protein BGX31_000428 [Mortierella sp. GBA43]